MTLQVLSAKQRCLWALNVLFHQGVAVVTVYILCVVFGNLKADDLATWHMALTPLGILLLMTESLIVYTESNIYSLYLPRADKQLIHSCLLTLSTILVTIGIAFRINTVPGEHFTTTHGILGLASWILMWCSILLGVATGNSQKLKSIIKPVFLKCLHALIGAAGFTLGVISLCYGLRNYFKFWANEDVTTAAIVVIAILAAWCILAPIQSIFNHVRNIIGK